MNSISSKAWFKYFKKMSKTTIIFLTKNQSERDKKLLHFGLKPELNINWEVISFVEKIKIYM